MSVRKGLAASIRHYKQAHQLTMIELAEDLQLAVSTTQEYLKGHGNPRADTLELIAQRMGISVGELLSSPPVTLERTESLVQAAKELSTLPPDKREKGARLMLEMANLFAGEE